MTTFIVACVVASAFIVVSLVLWGISFIPKMRKNEFRIVYQAFGTMLIVVAAIIATVLVSSYRLCSNCNSLSKAKFTYCPECGTEANPAVRCLGCENEFDADAVPTFCPYCGTKVEE